MTRREKYQKYLDGLSPKEKKEHEDNIREEKIKWFFLLGVPLISIALIWLGMKLNSNWLFILGALLFFMQLHDDEQNVDKHRNMTSTRDKNLYYDFLKHEEKKREEERLGGKRY